MLRRIFRKLHSMNRRSFLYILAKLHAKIIKSKQDTAKSFAYYNVAGAWRLHDVSANVDIYICIFKNFIIYSYIRLFLHRIFLKISLYEAQLFS